MSESATRVRRWVAGNGSGWEEVVGGKGIRDILSRPYIVGSSVLPVEEEGW